MNDNSAQSRSLSFQEGIFWFRVSCKAFGTQPLGMLTATLVYMLAMGVLTMIPFVGSLAAAFFMPFGSVYLARATSRALEGKPPTYGIFSALWRDVAARKALLNTGIVFACFLAAVSLIESLFGDAALIQIKLEEDGSLNFSSLASNIPWGVIAVLLLVYLPGLMMTWFAPLLIANKGLPCGKALFYSFFGCLRNLAPIFTLGIILLGGSSALSYCLWVLCDALDLKSSAVFIMGPVAIVVTSIAYGTYWPMFHSLFEGVRDEAPAADGPQAAE